VKLRREIGDVAAGRQLLHLLDSASSPPARTRRQLHQGLWRRRARDLRERRNSVSAGEVAVQAQQLAQEMGLQLYAGFHRGDVQFRQTDGHLDAIGQTINFVARLHKLTEDAPGQIFIVEETIAELPARLRDLVQPFGQRSLKGLGRYNIWTLNWRAADTCTSTVYASGPAPGTLGSSLTLQHGDLKLSWFGDDKKHRLGRGSGCELPIADAELRISTTHLVIDCIDGYWFVQDISRNGSWLSGDDGHELQLPYCQKAMLPRSGRLSLGRPASLDPAQRYCVQFTIEAISAANEPATRS
jgi:hypothetical protein